MRSLHESDDQLELYSLDRLPDHAVERVEEHLIVCGECAARLEEIGAFALTMRRALRELPPVRTPRSIGWFEGWHLRYALGGALACALVLGALTYRNAGHTPLMPVATLTLTATRGSAAVIKPAREVDLTLNGASGASLAVEIVDDAGKSVWQGTADSVGQSAHVRVPRELSVGSYFVRLKTPAGDLLHEYGFSIQR